MRNLRVDRYVASSRNLRLLACLTGLLLVSRYAQKMGLLNWARARELVGYYRYDTHAEVAKINEIWELDRVFTNYLLPQQMLIFKQRVDTQVINKHDVATTPHQCGIVHEAMGKRPIIGMSAAFKWTKPAALLRQIFALTRQLETLSQVKKAPRIKPQVNHPWNNSEWRRKPNEATS